jgi:hypothetical protein
VTRAKRLSSTKFFYSATHCFPKTGTETESAFIDPAFEESDPGLTKKDNESALEGILRGKFGAAIEKLAARVGEHL